MLGRCESSKPLRTTGGSTVHGPIQGVADHGGGALHRPTPLLQMLAQRPLHARGQCFDRANHIGSQGLQRCLCLSSLHKAGVLQSKR